MKLKMNQLALLAIGLSTASSAFAASVTVAEIDSARTAATLQQAWITGATAPTITVYEGWVRGCDDNTNTVFSNEPGITAGSKVKPGDIGNFNAYACKRAGIVSVLYHTLDGGSLNAYTPHTIGSVLSRVKYVGSGNGCNTTPLQYVDAGNSKNNATVFKACPQINGGVALPTSGSTATQSATNRAALATDLNAPQWPLGGFSDVEAALFSASIGGGVLTGRGTEADVGVGQVFGLAVTIPLYRAMQVAQGIVETGTANTDYDPAKAPNITIGQYAALISNGDRDLNVLLPNNSRAVNSTLTLTVHRRVDTSGTQSSSNAFFLRNPCNSGVRQQIPVRTNAVDLANFKVVLNSGSSNVKTNLTTVSKDPDVNKRFGIGVLSAENNWRTDSSASNEYRYLKIDGVHPEAGDTDKARLTANNGEYKFYMELKSFIRSATLLDGTNLPLTAFEAGIIPSITAQLVNPPTAQSCAEFPRGLSLNPTSGSICTIGSQVAKMTNGGQNCATATRLF